MLAPLLAETAPAADRSPADLGPSDAGSDKAVRIRFAELSVLPAVACSMAVEFNFTPELRLMFSVWPQGPAGPPGPVGPIE
jgi:hypothetical protein